MNERIRKIESQAWGQVPRTNGLVRTEDFNQKFAELIVKECMTVCADNACRAGGLNTQVGEDFYLAADLIKEHFGVEE